MKKWEWEMDSKTESIYKNLVRQIDRVFKHTRQGSYESRYRYKDGVKHFAKFIAETYKKQNLNRIENKHLEEYAQQMREAEYSNSYITTNLAAIRFFIDQIKDASYIKSNKDLGVTPRSKNERIGPDRAWTYKEIKDMQAIALDKGDRRVFDAIQIARDHGFRIHEVIRLDKAMLNSVLKKGKFKIKGKGGLVREVPLQNKDHIEKLYKQTSPGDKVFLLQTEKAHQAIEHIQDFIYNHRSQVQELNEGKVNLTFHGIRHEYAQRRFCYLMENGMEEIEARKKLAIELGHFRIEITQVYLKSSIDKKEDK